MSADGIPEGSLLSGRRLAQMGLAYSGEQIVRLLLALVAGIVTARALGPDGLGLINYATSVFGLVAPLAALGLPSILVREFSTRKDPQAILATAIVWQVPVALVAGVSAFAFVAWSRDWERTSVLTAAALLLFPLLSVGDTLRRYLEASGRASRIVITGIVAAMVATIARVVAALSRNIPAVAATITLEVGLVTLGLALAFQAGRVDRLRSLASRQVARTLLRESLPLLVASVAVVIYMRIDIVMLSLLTDDRETGIYSAAVRLSEVWYFLPMAAMAAIRPQLARLLSAGLDNGYEHLLSTFMRIVIAAAYAILAVTWVSADEVTHVLYGSQYQATAPVLRLHAAATPFAFVGVAASQWFVDRRLTRAVMHRAALGAGANVLANLVLIPTLGADGAALATVLSYAFAAFAINLASPSTRELFHLQARAFALLGAPAPREINVDGPGRRNGRSGS